MAAAPGVAMPVAVVPVLIVPMSVAVTTFPVAVAAMVAAVMAAMVAAVMAATAMLGHGCAWDRQSCQDGRNNREFSKHLLIPSTLGRRGFSPPEPLH
jgi:Na+/H+-translocating membrane pyrophosphatase